MIPKNRTATHPGEILLEEFLVPLDISQVKLAGHLDIPVQRVNEIVKGKRGISADTAWLLAAALRTSPEFWTNLQSAYDLSSNRPETWPKPIIVSQATLRPEVIAKMLSGAERPQTYYLRGATSKKSANRPKAKR